MTRVKSFLMTKQYNPQLKLTVKKDVGPGVFEWLKDDVFDKRLNSIDINQNNQRNCHVTDL